MHQTDVCMCVLCWWFNLIRLTGVPDAVSVVNLLIS